MVNSDCDGGHSLIRLPVSEARIDLEAGQLQALSSKLQRKSNSFRHGSTRITWGRGQLTSRSGVRKEARSRVVIDENAKGGGGLAGQLQAPTARRGGLRSKLQGKATPFA